ncbi:hypothetical protein P22_2168 [Propionispora sp. 2/2-37]|uniref:flagellar basal body rod protein FlgB n=1 Tax=Propionispora sp. 2/2-37 TaxID=1677858 RepID=UPI0006BB65B4|nr:flagellar basal body rod protein FlgB [Propionispora sp. 2/2-37]CUH96080.1 hypothetical protein P22_2168 [Propionispora sp. 2/2-37]
MLNSIVSPLYAATLEQALSASSLRHKVISNNIANVNTPGFKKSEVVFESLLQRALDGGDGDTLPLVKTHEKHLPLASPGEMVTPVVNTIGTTSMRTDENNVDVDIEMAEMAKNNIYYNAVAQQIGKYYTGIKSVINGGK